MGITIALPTLHAGQVECYKARKRWNRVRCGRRWGKTKQIVTIGANDATKRKKVAIIAPEHKQLYEIYDELIGILSPIKRRASKTEGTIRTTTGGVVDFWALNDNELACRGREYDRILGDEIAFTKLRQMQGIWRKSIKPTLLTTRGDAWIFSTPNGIDPDNFFFNPDDGEEWNDFHAPTSSNPMVPPEEIERERLTNHPLVFKQEFLAEFVDWSGVQFFDLQSFLVNGAPVPIPDRVDGVFAIIDSATKTGKEHDGTGVVYCSIQRVPQPRLVILDYDLVQIEGALLETWLPTVYQNLEALARETNARAGSMGVMIEDKASGMILLQQAQRRGWGARPIDSALTSVGKDERAISVSGYVYQGLVKFSDRAYNKNVVFKGRSKNHLVDQITSFKIGDKDQKRADDLTDCMTYAISVALGNSRGF